MIWWGSALAAALLIGAFIIWMVDRWRRQKPKYRLEPGDQLNQFRRMYEQGEISAEEFARIRGLLTERMIQELEPPAPPEVSLPERPRSQGS